MPNNTRTRRRLILELPSILANEVNILIARVVIDFIEVRTTEENKGRQLGYVARGHVELARGLGDGDGGGRGRRDGVDGDHASRDVLPAARARLAVARAKRRLKVVVVVVVRPWQCLVLPSAAAAVLLRRWRVIVVLVVVALLAEQVLAKQPCLHRRMHLLIYNSLFFLISTLFIRRLFDYFVV